MNEVGYEGPPPIDSYGGGGFRMGGVFHQGSLILGPEGMAAWSGAFDDLAPLLALAGTVDVLLLGMGAEIALPPAEARAALEAAGLGFEPMATASACRTYNVLLAEDRRVGAALIAV